MALAVTNLEQQARYLATDSREAHVDVKSVLWFPAADEIRLLVVTTEAEPAGEDPNIHPFYFPPSPEDGLDFWSATTLIQPEERGVLQLPTNWGTWDDAIEI